MKQGKGVIHIPRPLPFYIHKTSCYIDVMSNLNKNYASIWRLIIRSVQYLHMVKPYMHSLGDWIEASTLSYWKQCMEQIVIICF